MLPFLNKHDANKGVLAIVGQHRGRDKAQLAKEECNDGQLENNTH